MGMENYKKACDLIKKLGGDFEGEKEESLLIKAETTLGVKFPPSYRQFLSYFGCGDINGVEIFGVIDDNFENSSIPNGIWLTLNQRKNMRLNNAYVIISEGGDGTYCALDTHTIDFEKENPVIRLSDEGVKIEKIANCFGDYLLNAILE